jgi:hypothetical protein
VVRSRKVHFEERFGTLDYARDKVFTVFGYRKMPDADISKEQIDDDFDNL